MANFGVWRVWGNGPTNGLMRIHFRVSGYRCTAVCRLTSDDFGEIGVAWHNPKDKYCAAEALKVAYARLNADPITLDFMEHEEIAPGVLADGVLSIILTKKREETPSHLFEQAKSYIEEQVADQLKIVFSEVAREAAATLLEQTDRKFKAARERRRQLEIQASKPAPQRKEKHSAQWRELSGVTRKDILNVWEAFIRDTFTDDQRDQVVANVWGKNFWGKGLETEFPDLFVGVNDILSDVIPILVKADRV